MIFHWDVIQNTEEWDALRAGKMTASVAKTFLVKGKGENGFGVGAFTELYKMVEEKLTGEPRASFSNSATDYGHLMEDQAAEAYEMAHFIRTRAIGFVEKNEWIGCSPDRLIPSQEKGLEIKCFPVKHMEILAKHEYEKDQYIQCQFSLWVTGYKTWDLWYYHPKLPPVLFTFMPDKALFETFETRSALLIAMAKKRIKEFEKYV